MTISHKTYDLIIDNDWEKRPTVDLYWSPSKVSMAEVIAFVNWCGKFTGKLKVQFPNSKRHTVRIRKAYP